MSSYSDKSETYCKQEHCDIYFFNLHYEVHKDGKVVNPLNFYYGNISAVEYVVIAKLANQENQSLD